MKNAQKSLVHVLLLVVLLVVERVARIKAIRIMIATMTLNVVVTEIN
jgi:hypothetical protein